MRRSKILLNGITPTGRVTTVVVVGIPWATLAHGLTQQHHWRVGLGPRRPGSIVLRYAFWPHPSVSGLKYREPITYNAGSQLGPVPRAKLTHHLRGALDTRPRPIYSR